MCIRISPSSNNTFTDERMEFIKRDLEEDARKENKN
jgi:hypothetical protein